jgi:tellurite resistance protein
MSEREINLDHFKNLVAVSVADGNLDDDEKGFLEERAEELGLPSNDVSEIMANADKLEFVVPEEEADREEQLADIVFMAMVDGTIEDKEYKLCLNIAERLELKKEDLDEVIALTQRLWNRS